MMFQQNQYVLTRILSRILSTAFNKEKIKFKPLQNKRALMLQRRVAKLFYYNLITACSISSSHVISQLVAQSKQYFVPQVICSFCINKTVISYHISNQYIKNVMHKNIESLHKYSVI